MTKNKSLFLLPFLLLPFFFACGERQTTTVKLGLDFTSISNGKMEATLDETHDKLRMVGDLELMDGTFNVWLSNPEGDTVYSRVFNAVFINSIDTTFTPISGKWIFSYTIEKAEDVNPNGTFSFSLIY